MTMYPPFVQISVAVADAALAMAKFSNAMKASHKLMWEHSKMLPRKAKKALRKKISGLVN